MQLEHLNYNEKCNIEEILNKHNIKEFDAFVRLWGIGKSIQVDGDLGICDLKALTEIAIYLNCVEHYKE